MATNDLINLMNLETLATPPAEQSGPLRGTGGGLGDLIPAEISDGNGEVLGPAALSEGEFVIPADVVGMLGDGSSEAGARLLHTLINEIRGAKQGGNTGQATSIGDLLK